jgi:diadenosine tetraphosphatase ApaH/serine/threonine PP2A family protein phosphatase
MPAGVLDRLAELGVSAHWVAGNGEREMLALDGAEIAALEPYPAIEAWAVAQLSGVQKERLRGLPPTITLDVDGLGPVLFCHGSPRSDEEFITPFTPDERLAGMLAGVEERIVTGGHTHRQLDRTVNGIRVLNAGSIGMPYEGVPGAFWALLGPGVELRRTEYDIAAAAAVIRATGVPHADEVILRQTLLEPADPDEVSRFFEDQAG